MQESLRETKMSCNNSLNDHELTTDDSVFLILSNVERALNYLFLRSTQMENNLSNERLMHSSFSAVFRVHSNMHRVEKMNNSYFSEFVTHRYTPQQIISSCFFAFHERAEANARRKAFYQISEKLIPGRRVATHNK